MSDPIYHALTRRTFLARAAATLSAPLIIPTGRLLGAEAPSKLLNIAVIGCGWRATQVLLQNQPYAGVRFVATCDPFKDKAEKFAKGLNAKYTTDACKPYRDFREIIGNKDIDGVAVFTPDHWHVPVAIHAARYHKDMYVEKPLGVAMTWAWKLREEIEKSKIVFQYGTQQRSAKVFRRACEIVRNGYLGKVTSVDVWCNGLDPKTHVATREDKVPDGFDYDLWTGPSALRPYQPERVEHTGAWYCYDTALGFIAGWGAHPLDICQWGLDMDHTSPVSYAGTGLVPQAADELYNTTRSWDIQCAYDNGIKMRFMDDITAKPVVTAYHCVYHGHGTVFHGEDGWLGVDRDGMYSHDKGKLRAVELKAGDTRLPVSDSHFDNFLTCMRSREKTVSPFEAAIRSDTISHLSDIVVRTGIPLKWDPKTEKIIDATPAQTAMLDRPMREAYQIKA